MTNRTKWHRVIDRIPPENLEVDTKIDDSFGVRNEYVMIRIGKSWYLNDDSVFPYYTPTHWRERKIIKPSSNE